MDNTPELEEKREISCCSKDKCRCDDSCVDELARAICASDDDHIHPTAYDSASATAMGDGDSADKDSLTTGDTCHCEDNENLDKNKADQATSFEGTAVPASHDAQANVHTCGVRKRAHRESKDGSKPSRARKDACGGHQSLAKRQMETLASFGCICKAMIARGLQSCCSSKLNEAGRSIRSSSVCARRASLGQSKRAQSCASSYCEDKASVRSSHSHPHVSQLPKNASKVSIASSCGNSCCKEKRESIAEDKSCCGGSCCGDSPAVSRKSVDSCCASSCCGNSPVVSKESLDSCCQASCCGKSTHNVRDIEVEKAGTFGDAILELSTDPSTLTHAVLAIKGMTCTGCESKLIRTLKVIPTICNVKTSLVLARAEFDYHGTPDDLQVLIHTVEKRTGFTVDQVGLTSQRTLDMNMSPIAIEKLVLLSCPDGVEGVVRVNKQTVRVSFDPHIIGARSIMSFYTTFSPSLAPEPRDPTLTAGLKHMQILLLRTVISALLTIPVLIMTWAPLPDHHKAYAIASLVLASVVQLFIAGPFYTAAFKSLFFSGIVETDLLIVLSTTTAYVYSVIAFGFDVVGRPLVQGEFFETSTLLVTLIMVGQLVSAFARHRAIEAISLRSLQHNIATLLHQDGKEEEIDGRLLQFGDIIKVAPDSSIITDGIVVQGQSEVDESMMTGESVPVEKRIGSIVVAGTANGPSMLHVKITRLPGDNTISDIATMVDDARFSRAKVQAVVDKVCGYFVPAVLVISTIVFVIWIAVGITKRKQGAGAAVVTALTYAIAVLAISCPCAIGLAVPMVMLIASGVGAKRLGLIFKSATTIEEARKITHVVFDKTGTLTQGRLTVVNYEEFVLQELHNAQARPIILALVDSSKHPVARAVANYLKSTGVKANEEVQDIEMITGNGIQARLAGYSIRGGSARWLQLESHEGVSGILKEGYTTFCVTYNHQLLAMFSLADTLRPEATSVISRLRTQNINVSILSGDHPAAVERTASSLGIPGSNVRASCLPADKQAYIRSLTDQGHKVLFCGDGTNDAIALAQASIGVHLSSDPSGNGSGGVAASSAADVVLIHPTLTGILSLFSLSSAVHHRIMLNFAWSFVYNLVAILFAAGAFVNARIAPAYAGLGELVSVLPVVVIALQLKWFKGNGF